MYRLSALPRLLLAAAIVLAAVCLAGCGQQAATPRAADADGVKVVRLAYLPITHALPLFAARELETPDGPVRIELVKYGSWPELMDALNTGRIDGAAVLIELAVKAREQGIDVRAAALGHRDGNVIIGGPDITSGADLKGKIFAIPHKQSSHKLLLDQYLAQYGLTENDLTVVEMSPPEMPSGLAQGQIAGYCVAEPFGAKAIALGTGHILARSDELWPDSLCCALVWNGGFIDANKELARTVTQEYMAAGHYLSEHHDAQLDIASRYLKAKPAVIDLSLQWINYDDLRITRPAYAELIRRMQETNLIKAAPDYEAFVATELTE